jgi:F-type H+-transporting ATPase subunit delta
VIDSRITRRYVTALYDTAEKAGVADLVESDLGLVTYTLESSPDLEAALLQPVVPASKKKLIVSQIFADKIHEVTLNYLFLIIDMGRVEVIKETEPEYIRISNERRGIILAEVRTAAGLTPEQATRLKQKLEAYSGLKVDLNPIIDDSLIGGVSVRIGDTVLDGSVAGFLSRLREQLLGETG